MRIGDYILWIMALGLCLLCWSCEGPPPDHCANWWYYWRDGMVVGDMDKVKYLWDPGNREGVSSPHKTTSLVGVSDVALSNSAPPPVSVTHKDYPEKTIVIQVARDGGIDGVAEVVSHEFEHVAVYVNWGARIGQTGSIGGRTHSDTDAIPDSVETDTTPGSIGYMYQFDPEDPDTYRIQYLSQGWDIYSTFGDNEVLARVTGWTAPRSTSPTDDWSEGGKQWRH